MGRALILLCCAFLTACSSVQPQYYTLGTPEISSVEHQHKPVKSIGVARIRLPSLLDRQGMVLRKDNFSVEVSEQAQWAGILRDEVNESLIAGLQAALPSTRVQVAPWELEQTPQYYLAVKILEFDGAPESEAKLKGNWQLLDGDSNEFVKAGTMSFKRLVTGKEVKDVVRVQNELIGDLIRQVLAALP